MHHGHQVLAEAHRALAPEGALVLLDKKGAQLHWQIRAPAPRELGPVSDSRMQRTKDRWYPRTPQPAAEERD